MDKRLLFVIACRMESKSQPRSSSSRLSQRQQENQARAQLSSSAGSKPESFSESAALIVADDSKPVLQDNLHLGTLRFVQTRCTRWMMMALMCDAFGDLVCVIVGVVLCIACSFDTMFYVLTSVGFVIST